MPGQQAFLLFTFSVLTLQILGMPVWWGGGVCWISKDKYPMAFPICQGYLLWFCTLPSVLGNRWQALLRGAVSFAWDFTGETKNKKTQKILNWWLTGKVRDVLTHSFNYFPLCSLFCLSGLQRTLPWGTFSSLRLMNPTESDDGPIMWVRPGEQMIPVADIPKSPFKRKRWVQQSTWIKTHTHTHKWRLWITAVSQRQN